MSRFLRFCAFLSVLFFSANAMAAGYLCPTYRKYTSCNAGYYLNGTGVGNSCVKCPAGTYQPSNGSIATSCTECAVGAYNTGTGNTACLPCTNGYTNTTTGSSSCGTKCANNNGNVSSWIGEWIAATNTALDICGVDICKSGYERQTLSGGLTYCNANQYTVKYNGNGSTSGSMSNGTFYYNTEKTLAINGFSRTGYTFQGWSRSSSATTAEYVNAASVKFTKNSSGTIYANGTTINLYAVWKSSTYTCAAGQYLNVTSCEACTAGYYCPSSSKTYTYNGSVQGRTACAEGSYTNTTGKTSCTACQNGTTTSGEAKTSCNATCSNASGAYAWATASWSANSVTNACIISSCSAGKYKNGNACATCDSGYTSSNGMTSGRAYCYKTCAAKTGYTLTGGVDYYSATDTCAYSANEYSLSYWCEEGDGQYMFMNIATYDQSYTFVSQPDDTCKSRKAGYTFAGWTCAQSNFSGGQTITYTTAGDMICYGRWTANTYTVSFNVNGGSGGQSANVTATYSQAMPTISTTKPTRAGYVFMGWYDNATYTSGTQYYTAAGASARSYNKTSNTTLYAGWAPCTAGYYCPAGSTSVTQNKCPGLYVNSLAASDANTDCYFTTTGGKYIASKDATTQTDCEYAYYCPSTKLYYPNTGSRQSCPDPTTHKRTTFPSNYYATAIESTGLVSWSSNNKELITQCRVITWITGTRGRLYEYATYNSSTGKYDNSTSYDWSDVYAGYYLTTKSGCGTYAYYDEAKECPKNSYCPGKARVECTSSNQATVHTDTFGLNACTSLGSFYTTTASTGSTAASQCYGTTTAGKYIATKNSSTQTTCEAGYACPSANVYYGSTGSRSKCTGATYSGDGASSCTSCPTATLASATGDYGYWIGDDIHDTVTGCYAAHKTTNASGTIIGNCFADENGVYGRYCNNFNGSTCSAGYYYPGTYSFNSIDAMFSGVCVDVGSGNYFAGGAVTWQTAQVPSSCSALGGIGVSGANATYSSVSPRDTSKTCRFTAGAVTKTGCSSVVSNAVVYDGSNWGSNYYTAKAAKGYRVSSTDGANPSCTPCAAGTYQGSDNSTATTCGTCANWTYSGSGAASCTSCPTVESGYAKLDSTGTGWTTYTKCVEIASASPSNCSAGKLQKIPTASGATTWASPTVNSSNPLSANAGYYVSGTQCAACGGNNYYCTGGTAARKTVTTGYYSTGGTSTTRTGQSQCTGSTYCVSGEQKNCPTAETNWTLGTGTGWSAVTSCFETRAATNVSSNCSAGQLKKNATSSATWPTSASISVAFQANPGSIVSGQTCVQCTGATYSAGGTAKQCSACDTNYQANTSAGKSVETQCQIKCAAGTAVVTENNACADIKNSTYKGKFTTEHLVNYGSKSSISTCPTSYQDGNGTTAQANCINSCAAGTQVAAANADCSTPSNTTYGASWYTSAHNVTYGKTSKSMSLVGSCPSTYATPDTTTASNHDAKSDCTTTCAAGKVVASNDAACSVPSGSWYSVQHTVSAGSTSGTNKKSCNSGYATANTTTQTDHDAAADCKISCSAGYYIPTAGEGCKVCTAGKYCSAISNIAQTSTSAVTGNVSAGYWNNGCGTNATGSVCSTSYSGGLIAAGYYGTAGATASTGAGMVSGGYYSTGGGTSATPSSNGNGCVGTGNTCGKLSAAYYSNGGSTTNGATCVSGKVCGTCDSNYRANTNTGKTAVTQCQTQCAAGTAVVTENKACADIKNSTYKGKYTPQHNVAYGSVSTIQSCPTYYQDSSVGVAGEANCINSCAAGTQVATANADCSTPNTANWYTDAHNVTYGKTSANLNKVVSCDSDYGNSGTTAANHAGVTSCKVTCPAGTWVASANAACTDVTSGYYRTTSETVSQTKTGTRSACTDLGAIYNASDGGRDATTDCFATTTAKKWVASAKATAETTCTAGYYCGGGTKVYYNSTGGRKVCEAGSFCVAGVSEPTACAVGSYTSTTGQSECTACTNGKTTSEAGKTSCDATCANASGANAWSTASWTNNTVANLCTISKCNANTYYTATTATGYKNTCTACGANSSTSAGNTSMTCTCTTGYTSTGKVGGAATSTSGCSLISDIACAIGQYVPAKATSCSACTAGYYCPSTAKTYSYSSSIQGRTACSPGTYQPDTGKTSCVKASLGYYVSGSAQTEQTACSGATYAATEGQSQCTSCPTAKNNPGAEVVGYDYYHSDNGDTTHKYRRGCYVKWGAKTLDDGSLTKFSCYIDEDEEADTYGVDGTSKWCWNNRAEVKCNGGYYSANFDANSSLLQAGWATVEDLHENICEPVTAGYWSADESLNRTACATGLTTIGYGTAANEAEDCGRKLHAGNNVVYLRSGQRSTPTLKVRMKLDEDDEDYTVLYGALSTSLSGALKVKKGTTEYSVVNDWQ